MTEPDWTALAEPVARHFWGEPNKALSHRLELRWGGGGSRKLNIGGEASGLWHDFETGEKGGVLDLVMREQSTDKAGAIDWLASNGFIDARDPATPPQMSQDGRSAAPAPVAPSEPELPVDEPQAKKVMVEAYDYVSRDGERIYQVVRFQWKLPDGSWLIDPKTGNPKKTFLQRRKDEHGNIVWNLDGIGHRIYRQNLIEIAVAEGKTILMPEGEKDVHTLEAWGLVATTNSGGASNWQPHMAETFRGADVVILGDDDQAGHPRVEKIAMSLRGIAKRIRAIGSWGGPKDVTDWKETGHTASELGEIINTLPDWRPAPPVSAFNAGHIADVEFRRKLRKHSWLVHDLIELGGTCSFSGFSEAGKTFVIIELAFCIALGIPFFGHDVKQGLVIYQVGEDELGFEKRIEGYAQDRGITDRQAVPFIYLPKRINLFVDDKDTDALIDECRKWRDYHNMPLRVLVIDTFNKATRGANEISGQDMGKINDRVERIATELECTVILIDHLNAQGTLRGHGSKTGDVTNTVKVERTDRVDANGRKVRKIVFGKNKNGEGGVSESFVLRQVVVEHDEMGKQVTTCVVERPDGEIAEEIGRGTVSVGPPLLLRIIKDTADIMGTAAPPELVQVPPGRHVAKWDDVKAMVRKQWSLKSTLPKDIDAEVRRICGDYGNRLKLAGYIDRDNDRGLIWWTGKEQKPRPPQGQSKPTDRPKPSGLMTPDDLSVPF